MFREPLDPRLDVRVSKLADGSMAKPGEDVDFQLRRHALHGAVPVDPRRRPGGRVLRQSEPPCRLIDVGANGLVVLDRRQEPQGVGLALEVLRPAPVIIRTSPGALARGDLRYACHVSTLLSCWPGRGLFAQCPGRLRPRYATSQALGPFAACGPSRTAPGCCSGSA